MGIRLAAPRRRESSRKLCIETLLKHLPVRIADRFDGDPSRVTVDILKYTEGGKRMMHAARAPYLALLDPFLTCARVPILLSSLHIS